MRLFLLCLAFIFTLTAKAAPSPIIYKSVSGTLCAFNLITQACIPSSSSQWTTSGEGIYYIPGETGAVNIGRVSGAPISAEQLTVTSKGQNSYISFLRSATSGEGAVAIITLADIGGTFFDNSGDIQALNSGNSVVAPLNLNRQGGAVNIGSGAGTVLMPSYSDGTLSVASSVVVSSSDARLKDVQAPFERGVADLLKIKPVMYKWKKDLPQGANGFTHAGFIAQNIEEGVPEAVFEDENGTKSLEDRAIMALLINAVKEQAAEIRMLKDKLGIVDVQAKKVIPKPAIQRNKPLERGPCTLTKEACRKRKGA